MSSNPPDQPQEKTRDWTTLSFEAALAYLLSLEPMTKEEFDILDAEVTESAFTLSRVIKLDALQYVLDALAKDIEAGKTAEQFAENLDRVVESAMSDDGTAQVIRINIQTAYGAGKWQQGTDSDLAPEIWGWRYQTVGDDRVRPLHRLLEGREFATGEADALFPPWDYNCRCSAIWITNEQAGASPESSDIPPEVIEHLGETSFASPALRFVYKPDLSGFDPRFLTDFNTDQGGN